MGIVMLVGSCTLGPLLTVFLLLLPPGPPPTPFLSFYFFPSYTTSTLKICLPLWSFHSLTILMRHGQVIGVL